MFAVSAPGAAAGNVEFVVGAVCLGAEELSPVAGLTTGLVIGSVVPAGTFVSPIYTPSRKNFSSVVAVTSSVCNASFKYFTACI